MTDSSTDFFETATIQGTLTRIAALHAEKKFSDLESLCLNILQKEPDNFLATLYLGASYLELDQLDAAAFYASKLLKTHPTDAQTLQLLGKIFFRKGEYKKAEICYKKVTTLESGSANAWYDLATSIHNQERLPEAKTHYETALQLQPDFIQATCDLAMLHISAGQLDRALELFQSLKSPDQLDVNTTYHYVYLLEFTAHYRKAETLIQSIEKRATFPRDCLFGLWIIAALIAFQNQEYDKIEALLAKATSTPTNQQAIPDFIHYYVFGNYLTKIGLYRAAHPELYTTQGNRPLYVIGDSHCLSPAFTHFNLNGDTRQFIPKLLRGCQARYLATPKDNPSQAMFRTMIGNLPEGADILITFGEIDCRKDYGILPYHKKKNIPIKDIIKDITTGYAAFLAIECNKKSFRLSVCGVPALNIKKLQSSNHTDEEIVQLQHIIQAFNASLSDALKSHGIAFHDLQKFMTAQPPGAVLHIDNFHLYPHVFCKLLEQSA